MQIICAVSGSVANRLKVLVETATNTPCSLVNPGAFLSGQYPHDALLFGTNSLTSALIDPISFEGLGDDGYLVHFLPETNLVICSGNTLRSSLYAVFDWLADRNNISNRRETSAFKFREKMICVKFVEDFGKSSSRLIRNVFSAYDNTEVFNQRADDFVLSLLKKRVNTVLLTSMGLDYFDCEEIGFPEFYGEDDASRFRTSQRRYADAMTALIERCHLYDLRVAIYHCGVPGLSELCGVPSSAGREENGDWLARNFFGAHPEVESQVGRDDPSINWHAGMGVETWGDALSKTRSFCPSHPMLWDLLSAYYRDFFRRFDIDEYSFLIGDVAGTLHCGCPRCRQFPYADRIRRFIRLVHQEMTAFRPDCLLIHRNDDFVNYYPGRECELEEYVLDGLPNAHTCAKWAQPVNYDFGCDWRVIHDHPLIGKVTDLRVAFWYGWVAPTYDIFPGQYLPIYKKQLEFAAANGVTGITYFHEGDGGSDWQPRDIFSDTDKPYPWHADIQGFMKALWNPTTFDVGKFQQQWHRHHFGEVAPDLCRVFSKSCQVLDILGRWDIGDYCIGGLPPFSYFDRIWEGGDFEELANAFYIRTKAFEKQSRYPQEMSFFDATPLTLAMCMEIERAFSKRPNDQNLRLWVAYIADLHRLAMAYKIYHEAYFEKRNGKAESALKLLVKARDTLAGITSLEDYGQTSDKGPIKFREYFGREIDDQIGFIHQGQEDPYSPGKHWKGSACIEGEHREQYIYDEVV